MMTDYKQMYLAMMRAAEEAIARLSVFPIPDGEITLRNEIITILARGQQEAEDIYINTCDDEE